MQNVPLTFMWPQFLWLLLAVPLLVALYVWLLRRKKKLALRYASLSIVREALGSSLSWRRHIPPLLFLLAITAMLVASSRPFAVITSGWSTCVVGSTACAMIGPSSRSLVT